MGYKYILLHVVAVLFFTVSPTSGIVFAMAGKFFITGNFCLAYTYTGELYPTLLRARGIGAASMMARVGGILAPFLSLVGKKN